MRWIMKPGVAFMQLFSNKGKMPLCSAVYLLPLVVLCIETGDKASLATKITIVVCVTLGIYLMCSWYIQARDGFAGLGRVIDRLAQGDLTSGNREEMGGAFAKLMKSLDHVHGSLGGIVANVRGASDEVAQSAERISEASSHLSERTEQQASTLEETASGIEELARTVRQNAKNCERASEAARAAEDVARAGAQSVHGVAEGMTRIDHGSRRMSEIIGTIEGIAFQTNILALNAAVEAARAGEQGRGFAVVASEVRSLAQRCATAAHEVRALIQESATEIRDNNERAAKAGAVIDEMVSSVHEASRLIKEIAVASSEQSQGVGEVNKAISQLDHMTQQNASLAQDSASSSKALESHALALRQLVARFRIDEAAAAPAALSPSSHALPHSVGSPGTELEFAL